MNNDAVPALFGVGHMIWPVGEEQPYLTYGAEHRYVLSTQFTTDLPKEMPGVNLMAETMTVPGANYEGRDFPGQVVKTIGNVDYILIGNEDQLRAIGTGADVYTAVYQTTTHSLAWNSTTISKDSENQPVLRYGGDADLLAIQNGKGDFSFQRLEDVDESWWDGGDHIVYEYCGVDQKTGLIDTETNYDTGLNYDSDANYIIFRDITLSDNNGAGQPNWTPLMFSGNMIGAKAKAGTDQSTLWENPQSGEIEEAERFAPIEELLVPKISHVVIAQETPVEAETTQGVGFFATISNKTDNGALSSQGLVSVKNLALLDVKVSNNTEIIAENHTLLGDTLAGLALVLGGLLDIVLRLLTFGQVQINIGDVLDSFENPVYIINGVANTTEKDDAVKVENKQGIELPETGSIGTIGLTIAGVAVVAIGLFAVPRKKKEQD